MIVFDKVQFSHGSHEVLDGISFKIDDNERVAVLGGSGEGKTTILKLILRLYKPKAGRILIDDVEITSKTEQELMETRMKFSIVFQDGALFDSLNVKENVAFYLREYTKMNEEQIDRRVKELLEVVSVSEAISMMPEQLSGGMQRRVAIARSLAAREPRMFLYDEPTSDLDPVNAANIRNLILELSKGGRGFIIVTHEIMDALQVAQRFMFLKARKIIFDGGREELLQSRLPDVQAFMGMFRPPTP